MFTDYSKQIEFIVNIIGESFLYIAIDDNCNNPQYIINVGVMFFSLNKLETLLFCTQVLILQKTQKLLSYTPEWNTSGLNDQNIVISLLNDTKRLDIQNIQNYCINRNKLNYSQYENNYYYQMIKNLNNLKKHKGVIVIPNTYLNYIIRINHLLDTNNKKYWQNYTWIIHFSGSNSLEQKYLLYKFCLFLYNTNNKNVIQECPFPLDNIISIKELNQAERFFHSNSNSNIDQFNLINQYSYKWIQNLNHVNFNLENLYKGYSLLINK